MALTANARLTKRVPGRQAPEVINAGEIFSGGYIALGSRDHATAASRGRMFAWNDAIGSIPIGFAVNRDTGDTAVTPIVRGEVSTEGQIVNVAVTGLAGTEDDVSRVVYATDDNTFDLTRPTLGHPIGWVWEQISATRAHVEFFSARELALLGMSGLAQYTWLLGVVRGGFTASGDMLTGIEAPHHGRITNVYGIVGTTITDADADFSINLEIGGVNVTGGVITWLFSDANAAKKAGTAVTAANVFHEGDLIDIEQVTNTAGTANDPGSMNIYAEILVEPGI